MVRGWEKEKRSVWCCCRLVSQRRAVDTGSIGKDDVTEVRFGRIAGKRLLCPVAAVGASELDGHTGVCTRGGHVGAPPLTIDQCVFNVAPDNLGDVREKASGVKLRPNVDQRNDDDHRDRMPGPTPLPHSIR